MSPAAIRQAFDGLLAKGRKGIALRRKLGMTARQAAFYRYQLRRQRPIGTDTMLAWLRKAGHNPEEARYTAADMLAFARYAGARRNARARQLGLEYVLEKWEARR